jgi:hypothetical protein
MSSIHFSYFIKQEGEIGLHTRAEETKTGITNQPLDYVSSLQKGPKL